MREWIIRYAILERNGKLEFRTSGPYTLDEALRARETLEKSRGNFEVHLERKE